MRLRRIRSYSISAPFRITFTSSPSYYLYQLAPLRFCLPFGKPRSNRMALQTTVCFITQGDTDAKTAGALEATMQAAASYRPAIVLLREAEALGASAGGPAAGAAAHSAAALRLSTVVTAAIAAGAPSRDGWPLAVVHSSLLCPFLVPSFCGLYNRGRGGCRGGAVT